MTMVQHSTLLGIVVLVTAAAAVTDARSGRIPNGLTLPLVVAAPLAHFALHGPGGLLFSMLGGATTSAVPLVLFSRRAMGGGDVKLLGGIGGALGPSLGLEVQLGAYLIAGAYGVIIVTRRGRLLSTLRCALGFRGAPARSSLEGAALSGPDTVRLGIPVFLSGALCLVPRLVGA